MTPRPCPHEAEIVAAVLSRTWPDACDASLRAHADTCAACHEVVDLAALLKEDYDEARDAIARRDVPLPSAGQIWWRAAVHARADAAKTASRLLVWGYGAAAACAVGLLVAGLGALWPAIAPAFDRMASLAGWMLPVASATDAVMAALKAQLPIVLVVAACLVAVPVALYLALREE